MKISLTMAAVLGLLLASLAAAAAAVPSLPVEFSGQVLIDGNPAPAGTVIVAFIGGTVRGTVVTEEPGLIGGVGTFDRRLVVTATGEDLAQSPTPVINFTVNGVCTDGFATAAFESGETPVIAISSRSVAALPEYLHAPTDPDGDGIFEDLNGNGRTDFADVVAYFNQMQWIAGNEPVCAFDLNSNSRIDFADIVALFNEI